MASLRKTPSGHFIICFRWNGSQYQRSLKTKDRKTAEAIWGKIEHTLFQLAHGNLTIPEGVDLGDFLIAGQTQPPQSKRSHPPPSFSKLINLYLQDHIGQKAESSLRTEKTHLTNLQSALGDNAEIAINQVTKSDLETALRVRRKAVVATTVMKERQTLISFFTWAMDKEETHIQSSSTEKLCAFQEDREKKRFRTLEEIEQVLSRGGLSDKEVEAYWECLFLDPNQIGAILKLYQEQARHDFILPMVALAAYTGMRRGEILRLRWPDLNFEAGIVTARSRKQSRQTLETSRDIPMHSALREILMGYQMLRPQGQSVICKADSNGALTKDMGHDHFQRTLKGTVWERRMPKGHKKIILGFHTFRHSFASNLAAAGIDQRLIDSMMGHQTEEMRKRYQHLFPKTRRAAIDMLCYDQPKPDARPTTGGNA